MGICRKKLFLFVFFSGNCFCHVCGFLSEVFSLKLFNVFWNSFKYLFSSSFALKLLGRSGVCSQGVAGKFSGRRFEELLILWRKFCSILKWADRVLKFHKYLWDWLEAIFRCFGETLSCAVFYLNLWFSLNSIFPDCSTNLTIKTSFKHTIVSLCNRTHNLKTENTIWKF